MVGLVLDDRKVTEREIHIMDVRPAKMQQLRDAIMSIWARISEEHFQHLLGELLHF